MSEKILLSVKQICIVSGTHSCKTTCFKRGASDISILQLYALKMLEMSKRPIIWNNYRMSSNHLKHSEMNIKNIYTILWKNHNER